MENKTKTQDAAGRALTELLAVQKQTMDWNGSAEQHKELTKRWARAWTAARAALAQATKEKP